MHVRAHGAVSGNGGAPQFACAVVCTVTVMFGYALPCADCERAILDDHFHVQWRPFSVEIIGAFGNALDVCILLMVFRCVTEDFTGSSQVSV